MRQLKISDFISNYLERISKGKLKVWTFLSDLICAPLGWTFLLIKYRDSSKRTKVKATQYDDSYAVVGRTVAMQTILVFLGLLVLAVVIAIISGDINNQ